MELDPLILRWKKTTRALKPHDQAHGKYLTDLLGHLTDADLALFRDPVEAAVFFCLLDLVQQVRPGGESCPCRPAGALPGQSTLGHRYGEA